MGTLPQRMRFTVAHEIAHTLFYDINHGRPKHRLSVEHHKRLNTLESVCNNAAGRILLPTDLLRTEMKKANPFDPRALRHLAEKAAVSGPMLVNRIREIGAWVSEVGVVAYVEPEAGSFIIKAVSVPPVLRQIFPDTTSGVPFSRLCPTQDFFLNGGKKFKLDFSIRCETKLTKGTQRFQMQCEGPDSRARHRGIFATARRIDDPL
ncbi:MAG: ImmA/IrrE family metallo-endopeptidase [Verrucomicrobiales bacterium]|nr:ImmA/IrrE family metallo-endopeptidase [Verrucomicrobiales bacterium]